VKAFSHLERFQAKWRPVRVKKTRQIKNLEPRFDSIEAEKALVREAANGGLCRRDKTLGAPAFRAFIDVMHKTRLFLLDARKLHLLTAFEANGLLAERLRSGLRFHELLSAKASQGSMTGDGVVTPILSGPAAASRAGEQCAAPIGQKAYSRYILWYITLPFCLAPQRHGMCQSMGRFLCPSLRRRRSVRKRNRQRLVAARRLRRAQARALSALMDVL
jgi:hypothetical protein